MVVGSTSFNGKEIIAHLVRTQGERVGALEGTPIPLEHWTIQGGVGEQRGASGP
jgi:hypothetical protein